jgi:hypothetical protein
MTGQRRGQRAPWPKRLSRDELDGRKLQPGDRVWCAGRPYVVTGITAEGRICAKYDPRPQPPQHGAPR